jgi:hypothetical protein
LPPQLATKKIYHSLAIVWLLRNLWLLPLSFSSVPCRFVLWQAVECGGHFLRHTVVALPNLWRD